MKNVSHHISQARKKISTRKLRFTSPRNLRVPVTSAAKKKNLAMLNSGLSIVEFVRLHTNNSRYEKFFVFWQDIDDKIVDYSIYTDHAMGEVTVPYHRIIKRTLSVRAPYIIAAHNHPCGSPAEPSDNDLEVALNLATLMSLLGFQIRDFMVVNEKNSFSAKQTMGLALVTSVSDIALRIASRSLTDEEILKQLVALCKKVLGPEAPANLSSS